MKITLFFVFVLIVSIIGAFCSTIYGPDGNADYATGHLPIFPIFQFGMVVSIVGFVLSLFKKNIGNILSWFVVIIILSPYIFLLGSVVVGFVCLIASVAFPLAVIVAIIWIVGRA